MDQPFHTELDVPVAGGHLRVGLAGPALPDGTGAGPGRGPVVLAVHGITASYRSWVVVARALGPDVTVLAPDLRGRGRSNTLPGPFGLAAHVDDLVAVLDHLVPAPAGGPGAAPVVVAGHSMGAYVAARLAAAHPDRVSGVVLVDGGLPLPVPEGLDPDTVLEVVLGPALARLRKTFPSPEAYREFWRAHPAFAGPGAWSADADDYVDYDLMPADGGFRSRVVEEAVRRDGRDLIDGAVARRAFLALGGIPTVVVRAPRGLLDEPRPFLPDEVVAEARAGVPGLVDVEVPDTNHYLLVLRDREAAVVADQIRQMAGGRDQR